MKVKSIFKKRKKLIVMSILLTVAVFSLMVYGYAVDEMEESQQNYSNYEQLEHLARTNGSVRVIAKLKVPQIKELTAASNRYYAVAPGQKSQWGGFGADIALRNAIASVADTVLENLSGTQFHLGYIYTSTPYIALEVSAEGLALLESRPEILSIEEDKVITLANSFEENKAAKALGSRAAGSPGASGASAEDNLSRAMLDNTVGIIGADDAWSMGYTGSGWYVAVLDTGIRRTHEFFSGKTIVEACFASGEDGVGPEGDCPNGLTTMTGTGSAAHHPSTYLWWDHGTHVTGIAAGNNGTLFGVAKDANIIAIQVFSKMSASACGGTPCVGSWKSDSLAGLDYIYSIRGSYPIAAVNISFGENDPETSYCDDDVRKDTIYNLEQVGISTIIATGNGGYCAYGGAVYPPSCISSAVSVGSSTDADERSYFSNWHVTLQELFAPGSSIYSSTGDSNSSYESWSGTSMAAPHVTGAWALLKQANSTKTVSEYLAALQATGVPIYTSCDSYTTPISRIQVDAAITSLLPEITVTDPNGGESWSLNSTHDITWVSQALSGNLEITLWKNGVLIGEIATGLSPTTTSYSWQVGQYNGGIADPGTGYTIKVSEIGSDVSDESDASFTITGLKLTSPNGGESWLLNSQHNITWISEGITGNVKLALWKNGGLIGEIATGLTPTSGSYTWQVGQHSGGLANPGTGYIVKVSEVGTTNSDESDTPFTIRGIKVTSPNGGENWQIKSQHNITWIAEGIIGNVKLVLWKNGVNLGEIATNINSEQESYTWTVGAHSNGTADPGSGYIVRVREMSTTVYDESDSSFNITGIKVTSPNGGENWLINSQQNITWIAYGLTGDVKIVLWKDGVYIDRIETNLNAYLGTYTWTVGTYYSGFCEPGTGYTIRVREIDTSVYDDSDASFNITGLKVTSPNGGEDWVVGFQHNITWTSTGPFTDVMIRYSVNGGMNWSVITMSTPNDGSYSWTVPNTPSTTCKVIISDSGATTFDTSDNVFTISEPPSITVTSPNGGESWKGGTTQYITWTSTGTITSMLLSYSVNNGASWIEIGNTYNTGSYGWTLPHFESSQTNCLVKVEGLTMNVSDTSDGIFTILGDREE